METIAFVQGILSVIGLLMVVGVVWAIYQVANLKNRMNSTNSGFDRELQELRRDLYDGLETTENYSSTRINDVESETRKQIEQFYRDVDSRFDKFENRLKSNKQLLNG